MYILWTLKSVPQENKLVETPYKNSTLVTLKQANKKPHIYLALQTLEAARAERSWKYFSYEFKILENISP